MPVWGRAGAHSGLASVVSAFGSPLLAPGFAWRPSFRGRRCYTHLPPGGLALGVIPTGVRLFFFYFPNPRGVLSFLSVWRYPYSGSAVFLLFSEPRGGGGEGGSGSPRCFFFPVSFLSITRHSALYLQGFGCFSLFSFWFLLCFGSKKKRNFVVCAAGAGSVDIPYFDSHASLLR